MKVHRVGAIRGVLALFLIWAAPGGRALAAESPTSYGEAATVDSPILRAPMTSKPPKIDGEMAEGEWEDASALSGYFYDYSQADFRFIAPIQTQLQTYAAYDKENLYIAYTSPVYPENSWLKAQGRFSHLFEPERCEPLLAEIQAEVDAYWDGVAGGGQGSPDREGPA